MNKKAIVVYLDNSDKMETEFTWLYKTWLLWSLEDEYDLVVYYNPDGLERIKKFKGIVAIPMPYIRIAQKYKFLNSHYFCYEKEYSNHLLKYDYIMKTDCDVFLTERMRGFIPSKIMIGEGGYYSNSDIDKMRWIENLSKKWGLSHKGFNYIGASFFGETDKVINLTLNQALLTENLLLHIKNDSEFEKVGFQPGIASMIAGEMIVNHTLSQQHFIPYSIDSKCWETTKIGSDTLHIHAWHTNQKWSKHDFFKELYNDWVVDKDDAFSNSANYCQFISKLDYDELYNLKKLYLSGQFKPDYKLFNIEVDEQFSVIIPTMWKSNRTLKLLEDLNNCQLVNEIIIIDNNPSERPEFNISKCKVIEQKENIYVNPAWNLGVKISKNELIVICNDDINFSVNEIFDYVNKNKKMLGCIGVHPQSYVSNNKIGMELGYHTGGGGWGCLMFCKKENWIQIPEDLKIGYGDDWIAITNKPTYSLYHSYKIETEMSTTSSQKVFNQVVNSDIKIWKRIFNK